MFNKYKFLSTICACLLLTNVNAKEFTLDELISIAISNNTNIEISKNQEDIKKQELKKAKSAYLPNMSVNADIGDYNIKSNGITQNGDGSSVVLSVNQLVYDFGKTSLSVKGADLDKKSANYDISINRNKIILDVKKVYYDILNKYQQIIVSNEAVKLDKLQLIQAKEYFKAGVRTKIDVTNAELKLSNSELKLLKAKYALKNAKTKLISILGKRFYDGEYDLNYDLSDIKHLAKSINKSINSEEYFISLGIKNRLELEKYDVLIQKDKNDLKVVKKEYYPKIDLSASYSNKNSNDISSLDNEQRAVVLNLKWNLYTGNSTELNKKVALINIKNRYKNFEQEKLNIEEFIKNSYYNLKESIDSIKMSLLSLDLATKNLDLANQRYKAGLNDLVELNDASLDYIDAKTSLVNIYYEYLINKEILNYNIGE